MGNGGGGGEGDDVTRGGQRRGEGRFVRVAVLRLLGAREVPGLQKLPHRRVGQEPSPLLLPRCSRSWQCLLPVFLLLHHDLRLLRGHDLLFSLLLLLGANGVSLSGLAVASIVTGTINALCLSPAFPGLAAVLVGVEVVPQRRGS